MKRRLGIIGVGSAGLLSLTHFCTWLDNDWEIFSIHNPRKQILGIGESTNGGFVGLLERGTHFCLGHPQDLDALDATLKFGSKFMNWRHHSWINPLLDGNTAIHFNNNKFKDFVYERMARIWPKQFRVLEGDVTDIQNRPDGVTVVVDGTPHSFDYVVDCMGFPPDHSGYTISDCSPVNRCLIHSLAPGEFPFEPFTDHIAHENGWMFGVPLQSRKTYGYLFNDTITPKEEAVTDMARLLNAKELDAALGRGIATPEYRFKCYYANQMIEGRVGKNGNKALFFEPLVANSIFLYIYNARLFYDFILGNTGRDECNRLFTRSVNEMEDVISYYYQGGSLYDTKFWRYATSSSAERLKQRADFQDLMKQYRELRSRGILHHGPTYAFVPLTWEIVDEQLGYSYIAVTEPESAPVGAAP
ncbi:MAG: tryptophan 7-halogenase [Armatimonadetes bacterium]|nr:tryptophan 7-halogenase [Armatimonadota bacterium]